jgi:cytochrome c oxidase subunit IV
MSLLSTPSRQEEEYTGPAFGKAEHGHPSDMQFIGLAVFLAVLTAIEVALYYVEKDGNIGASLNTTVLLVLAAIKFILVAGVFMHLKYDHPQFKRYFIGGGILAGFCYCAVLTAFGFFTKGTAWFIYGGGVAILLILMFLRNRGGDHGDHDHDHGDSHSHDSHSHDGDNAHAH